MKTRRILLAVLSMLLSLTVLADNDGIMIDGIYYRLNAGTMTAEVVVGPLEDEDVDVYEFPFFLRRFFYRGDVVIPSSVTYQGTNYSVTSIGKFAFYWCSGLNSVTIPNSVTSIGQNAFYECTGLTSVTILGRVTSIGAGAFEWCSSLASINIPNSVTSIGGSAFSGCSGLTSITIPNSVTSIGGSAFYGCSGLTSITIPNSVSTISDSAFKFCRGLTSITIPNSVTSIGQNAFYECTGLTSVTILGRVTSIGEGAFSGCCDLAFIFNCETVYSGFKGLSIIKEVLLGEDVVSVADEAFNGCKNIVFIELPSTITEIGQRAFANIDNLTDVFCFAKEVPNTNRTAFENSYIDYATLHVPEQSIETYKVTGPWSGFKSIVAGVPTYTLTYVVDGVTYKSTRHEEGETIIPEELLTKEGYTFSGWSEIPQTMPAQNVTVTGSFTVNKYNLTYIVDGEQYKSYKMEYGSAITPEAAPTKDGYIFSGWSEIPKTMPAQDVTVTGTFTVNNTKYTLTYMVDGEVYKSYQLKVGSTIIPESEPTKAGYTFSGWSEIPEEMPAHDVTVTGMFTRISLGKCASPTIELKGGRIVFSCETEGVEFNYDIKSNVSLNGKGNDILVNPSISVSVYASKDGYDNSDVTTKDILLSSTGMNLDANGDGVINAADVVAIVNAIMSEQQ